MVIPESRSCEERDGRGFKPLLEHLSFFCQNFGFELFFATTSKFQLFIYQSLNFYTNELILLCLGATDQFI